MAGLAGMSADYYGRIDQQRGPMPSAPILAAVVAGAANGKEAAHL